MALATLAAIIASQAVISGAFSMTKQAIQLGFLPSMTVRHTVAREAGQIYMPAVNWALLAGVMAAVAFFRNAAALAGIYGIAVTLTMFTTTLLTFFVVRDGWRLPAPVAVGATLFFLVLDGRLVAGCAVKLFDGGWFAPATGLLLFGMKSTWLLGRALLRESLRRDGIELQPFIDSLGNEGLRRVARSAVFLMAEPGTVPNALLHNFKHNPVVHGRNALVTVVFHEVPWIGADRRAVVLSLGHGFWRVELHFGFMDKSDVPKAFRAFLALVFLRRPPR